MSDPSLFGAASSEDELREQLVVSSRILFRLGLVDYLGHVSARMPGSERVLIKPKHSPTVRRLDSMRPDQMVVVDLDGNVVDGSLAPSSDTDTHAYIYRAMDDVGGVVHTHSPYATAWAARGEAIPCVLTAIADEFGGPIPVGPFALIGGDDIGKGVVETLARHRSRAVLMKNHGVFTVGSTVHEAVKAAVMCEDVARAVHLARALGEVTPLPDDAVDALYERYQNVYGQR
jgi:L-ribulose-5-phosphate 4-epimerase